MSSMLARFVGPAPVFRHLEFDSSHGRESPSVAIASYVQLAPSAHFCLIRGKSDFHRLLDCIFILILLQLSSSLFQIRSSFYWNPSCRPLIQHSSDQFLSSTTNCVFPRSTFPSSLWWLPFPFRLTPWAAWEVTNWFRCKQLPWHRLAGPHTAIFLIHCLYVS